MVAGSTHEKLAAREHHAPHSLPSSRAHILTARKAIDMMPLHGIRVLDVTHVLAGPYCGYLLALLGADVVKVEHPREPDVARTAGPRSDLNAVGLGTHYLAQGGGKACLALDLEQTAGAAAFLRLVSRFDIVIHNFRPGALDAMGLGFETLRTAQPRLIHCAISGFGQGSPLRAFDNVIQAASGLMAATGTPESGPMMSGSPVIDYATGLTAAMAVLAALIRRDQTGGAQSVDVAMFDAALALLSMDIADTAGSGRPPKPDGNSAPTNAGYSCYATSDGLLMLGAYTPRLQRRMWAALGEPERPVGETLEAVARHAAEDRAIIAARLCNAPTASWLSIFEAAGIPVSAVEDLGAAVQRSRDAGRPVILRSDPPGPIDSFPGLPFVLGGAVPHSIAPPRRHGADTSEVLRNEGFTDHEIVDLTRSGVAYQMGIPPQ
jgi:crotonobetainyl-CoA:carnitine CoA-transferase CaiB-like acyl-CoA transferase